MTRPALTRLGILEQQSQAQLVAAYIGALSVRAQAACELDRTLEQQQEVDRIDIVIRALEPVAAKLAKLEKMPLHREEIAKRLAALHEFAEQVLTRSQGTLHDFEQTSRLIESLVARWRLVEPSIQDLGARFAIKAINDQLDVRSPRRVATASNQDRAKEQRHC